MGLGDRQIERYSRQIILPEVGGRGQERLLASVVTLAGAGDLAATAARYLAGAGIGELRLDGAGNDHLASELRALNPDVSVQAGRADATATVVVAADLAIEAFDACARRTRALGVPLVAAAAQGTEGWLYVDGGGGCAGCAARSARWARPDDTGGPLAPIATGVLGSLLALAALDLALGRSSPTPPLRWFDATSAALTPVALARAIDCHGCTQRG